MLTLSRLSFIQRLCIFAAVVGVVAGIIGPDSFGWNLAGIAEGVYLAALGLWINDF